MPSRYREEDLSKVRPISIADRESKVTVDQFVDPDRLPIADGRLPLDRLRDVFPGVLKGESLKRFAVALARARSEKKEILWLLGAHVLKCGLSLYVRSLIEQGYITAMATTGSAAVHDLEVAFFGRTSEDVAEELPQGRFGMAGETADHFSAACRHAGESEMGLGEGVGAYIEQREAPHRSYSVFAAAHRQGVPATVHVALGTDIVHQHASFPGSLAGGLSMKDFRILSSIVGRLFDRGVVVVFGSAVVLPEVFLKAVSIGYNLGKKPVGVTAASFDMHTHYRVKENVLTRPFRGCGESHSFNGHHELMLPLLYLLVNRLR